jgi:CheY-like chemotaxis protein
LHFPLPRGSADSDTNLFRKTPPPAPGVETPGDDGALRGVRVLVVEDDQLQARMLARLLQRLGCEVIDVASTVHAALESAEHAELEGAVLDVNLGTATSAAVADALARRGIPYFFVTGYARAEVLPPHLADVPRLGKPVEPANLEALARKLFAHGSA